MLPATKQVIMIDGTSVTNAATATGTVDTQGFDFVSIDLKTGTSDDTTNNPSVLKVEESDDLTTYAAVSGCTGDTDFTIADSVTSGSWGAKFNIDLRGKKRYLKVSVSPLTTQIIDCIANLSRGDESPNDTTKANVKNLVDA